MFFLKKQIRKILFTFVLTFSCIFASFAENDTIDYSKLITAIGTVESNMKDNLSKGVHAGFLQISKTCVADCNRINKINGISKRYKLSDRFNHEESIEMFYIVQNYYNKKNDLEYAILLWNEGCSAMKKPKRKTKYLKKVMKIFNGMN